MPPIDDPGGAGPAPDPANTPANDPPASDPPAQDPPAQDPPAQDPGARDPAKPAKPADTSWRESIADADLRKHAERFASASDLVKANLDQHKVISGMVKVPGEDASDEDKAKFRKAIGVPESPDGYGAPQVPEGLPPELLDDSTKQLYADFASRMHAANAPKGAVDAAMRWYFETENGIREAMVEADKANATASENALRAKWGADFDANKAAADQFLRQFGAANVQTLRSLELKSGRYLLDDPTMLEMFANAGRALGEGGAPLPLNEGETKKIGDEINEIMALKHHPDATQRAKWRDPNVQNRLMELRRLQVGSAPPVGVGGRTA